MQRARGIILFSMSVLVLALSATLMGVRVHFPEAAYADTRHEYKSVFVAAVVNEEAEATGWKQVDEKEFMEYLRYALDRLADDGFEVIEVTPITRGKLDSGGVRHGVWAGGYSVTQGVVIFAEKQSKR